MQILAYIRISAAVQNLERQRAAIANFNPDKTFEDVISGNGKTRPALNALMQYCREGDRIIVPSIDRLGRSFIDLHDIILNITQKGVSVLFINENLEFNKYDNDYLKSFMFNMLSSFAQFEREMIRERQREGIAIAKKKGKFKGGKQNLIKKERIIALYKQGISRRKIVLLYKVASYPTVSKVIKEYEKNIRIHI